VRNMSTFNDVFPPNASAELNDFHRLLRGLVHYDPKVRLFVTLDNGFIVFFVDFVVFFI